MEKIDTSKPVYFYDNDNYSLTLLILYENYFEDHYICLCSVRDTKTIDLKMPQAHKDFIYDIILFDKFTGEILTKNYQYWKVKN